MYLTLTQCGSSRNTLVALKLLAFRGVNTCTGILLGSSYMTAYLPSIIVGAPLPVASTFLINCQTVVEPPVPTKLQVYPFASQ